MTVRHLGPRTLGATLTEHMASFAPAARALGLPPADWSAPKAFTFRRRKDGGVWGWEIGLQVGPLWMNLNSSYRGEPTVAPFLPKLADARAWAIGFAEKHGFKPMEQGRRRAKPRLRLVDPSGRAR